MYRALLVLCLLAAPAPALADWLGSKDPGLYNLKGQIYYLPEGTDHMPDGLDKQKVEGVVYTDKLDVPEKTRAPNRRVEIFVKP